MQRHDGSGCGRIARQSLRFNDGASFEDVWIVRYVDVFQRGFVRQAEEIPQLDGAIEGSRGEDGTVTTEGQARYRHDVAGQVS